MMWLAKENTTSRQSRVKTRIRSMTRSIMRRSMTTPRTSRKLFSSHPCLWNNIKLSKGKSTSHLLRDLNLLED